MTLAAALLVLALAACAAGWLRRRNAVASAARAEALFGEALARIEAGEHGVRVEADSWGATARLASGFNALVHAYEAGHPDAAGLPGHHALFERLRGALDQNVAADGLCTYVAIVEIERFASLRRGIGTQLANRLLAHVADTVIDMLDHCEIGRTNRTTIEFAFRAPDRDEALARLDALARLLEQRIELDGFNFDLPIVIGFADCEVGTLREELIDQAAAALAAAQHRHAKVGYAEHTEAVDDSFEDLVLMRDLPRAMAADELELHYQPKLRSRTNRIDSAEALLRWTHAERGPVPVDRLIELAENTGAIRDLTEWVLARAVADQRRFAAKGHDIVVYVNISGILLPDRDFAKAAVALVATAPGRIGFEITETAVIDDPDGALANLGAFSEAGIKIAIDDYGSGLSSLAYLKQLPANELKIDRMFVSGLTKSHRDPLLVRSSIDLAHALEMEVTAEGVDDAMALSLLRVMGCDLVQGYLISPPLPAAELEAFLADDSQLERLAPPAKGASKWRVSKAG